MDSISYRYSLARSENVICPTSTPPVFENIALYTSITLSFLITWVPPGMGLIFLPATNVSSPHKRNLHSGASMLASMFTKGVGSFPILKLWYISKSCICKPMRRGITNSPTNAVALRRFYSDYITLGKIKTEGRSCLGWKHIAIPGYGAALIIFFKVLLLSPIRHYFPDRRAVERTGAWQRPSGI